MVTCECPLFSRSLVDREGDFYSFVESYVVHLPLIGLGRPNGACKEETLILFFMRHHPRWNDRRQRLLRLELDSP
jgi:hypothetical protein